MLCWAHPPVPSSRSLTQFEAHIFINIKAGGRSHKRILQYLRCHCLYRQTQSLRPSRSGSDAQVYVCVRVSGYGVCYLFHLVGPSESNFKSSLASDRTICLTRGKATFSRNPILTRSHAATTTILHYYGSYVPTPHPLAELLSV